MIRIFLAGVLGVALGVATSFGQTYLPNPVSQLANSFSVWLLVSFIFGVFSARHYQALAGGGLLQVAALFGYYLTANLRFDSGHGSTGVLLFWLVGGVLGGPVLGLAGHLYRSNRMAVLALSAITVVILSEALYMFAVLRYTGEGVCFLTLAALVFAGGLALQRRRTSSL